MIKTLSPIRHFAALLLGCAGIGGVAHASTVQPVVLDLEPSGRAMNKIITVSNTAAQPLPVEMRIESAVLTDSGLRGNGTDPGDLMVFPPQALIAPGKAQTFRVQYVGKPDLATSKHYYVTVAQLPAARPEGATAIQLLYNFQVLVSVQPQGAKPLLQVSNARIVSDGGKSALTMDVANSADGYGYLSQGSLLVVQKDASGKEIDRKTFTGSEIQQLIGYGLLQPGQTRNVVMPLPQEARGVSVDVRFIPLTRRR